MPVRFYTTKGPYGCLSNFSRHGCQLDGVYWPTVEHYFQAQKFPGTEQARLIQRATTPGQAKELGRSRTVPIRSDWEEVKDDVMRRAVLRKFEKHSEAREVLLGTGDEELIEDSPSDYYWGCGADGTGQNMLGKILMEVRASLSRCAESGKEDIQDA
jgi:N-glycosidase YbiA